MRNKKVILFVMIGVLICLTATSFAETKKLKRIGSYTFARVRGKIPTQEVMKTLCDRYSADIKYGFDLAGSGDLYLPFMEQLKAASFKETTLAVGDKLVWMLFRSGGKVKVARDIEWAGKAPLEVFSFYVKQGYRTYEFIIPKPCGNIALRGFTEEIPVPVATCSLIVTPDKCNINDPVTVDMSGTKNAKSMTVEVFNAQGQKIATQSLTPGSPKWQTKFDKPGEYTFKAGAVNPAGVLSANPCQTKTYVNFPPICKLWTSCLPCNDYVGRPIVFDANGSTDPDGEIVKASFEITDPAGAVVDSFIDTEKPFTWEKIFKKAGVYTVTATVFDNAGGVAPASEACRVTFEVTQKKFFWVFEGGPLLAHGTYTTYFFLRAGIFTWLSPDRISFTLTGGGAVPSRGDPWRFLFLANALVNVHAGPAFFGGGLGYSSKEQNIRKSGLDLVGNVGVDIFNKYTSLGSLFFEFRSPVGSGRSFDDHHKFLLGFRLIL